MPSEWIKIDDLIVDQELQGRVTIDEATIAAYVQIIRQSKEDWPFDEPCLARKVDGVLYLADGFQRRKAMAICEKAKVLCDWSEASHAELVEVICAANARHGLPRSTADKKRVINIAMDNFPERPQVVIAEMCDVSRGLVSTVVRERRVKSVQAEIEGAEEEPLVTADESSRTDEGAEHVAGAARDFDDDDDADDDEFGFDDDDEFGDDSEDDVHMLERPAIDRVTSADGRSKPATRFDALQQRTLIIDALAEFPTYSNRAIAEALGCDHKTVGSVRRELSGVPDVGDDQDEESPGEPDHMRSSPGEIPVDLSSAEMVDDDFDSGAALEKLRDALSTVRDSWPEGLREDFPLMLHHIASDMEESE